MFTGIIQALGKIKSMQSFADDVRFEITAETLNLDDVQIGDSIAVNGVCLTIVAKQASAFSVDVSKHTLSKTTFKNYTIETLVNLEKCLQANSYLGGHLVSGHVDGIAKLLEKNMSGRSEEFIWEIPQDLLPFIAEKGSVTLDGISLTVNSIQNNKMGVTIIPHTLEQTHLQNMPIGNEANIEVDLIARYVARILATRKI